MVVLKNTPFWFVKVSQLSQLPPPKRDVTR